MNAKSETGASKGLVVVLGAWALCVAASVAATWMVSVLCGFHFDAAIPVVLSSAAVATGYALRRKQQA